MKQKKIACDFLKIIIAGIFVLPVCAYAQAQTKQWVVPKEALAVKNPLANDAASVNIGRTLYKTQCSPCHGDKGKGDGPAAAALTPKPADHTSMALQQNPTGHCFIRFPRDVSAYSCPDLKIR